MNSVCTPLSMRSSTCPCAIFTGKQVSAATFSTPLWTVRPVEGDERATEKPSSSKNFLKKGKNSQNQRALGMPITRSVGVSSGGGAQSPSSSLSLSGKRLRPFRRGVFLPTSYFSHLPP